MVALAVLKQIIVTVVAVVVAKIVTKTYHIHTKGTDSNKWSQFFCTKETEFTCTVNSVSDVVLS